MTALNLLHPANYVARLAYGLMIFLAVLISAGQAMAQVTASQSFDPYHIAPGGNTIWEITITNNHPDELTDVAFSHDLPTTISGGSAEFTDPVVTEISNCDNSTTPSLTAPFSTVIEFSDGSIASGQTCRIRIALNAPAVFGEDSFTSLRPTITHSVGTTIAAPTPFFTSVSEPGFQKEFSPPAVDIGGISTLQFTIGQAEFDWKNPDLQFTDTLPAGMTIADSANETTTCRAADGYTLTAIPGTGEIYFEANGNDDTPVLKGHASCTVSVDVVGTAEGTHDNSSQLFFNEADIHPLRAGGFAIASLTVGPAELTLTKQFTDDPVFPGDDVTLEFTLENTGANSTMTGITFYDPLPAGLEVSAANSFGTSDVCGTGSSLSASSGSTTLTLTGGELDPSSTCTFSVTLTVPSSTGEGTYTNTATNLAADNGITGSDASDDLVVDTPDIEFSKEFVSYPVASGGRARLQFKITNPAVNTEPATDIAFTDDLEDALSGLALSAFPASPCGGALSGTGEITYSGGTVAAGETCTFTVTLTVPASATAGAYTSTTSELTATIGTSSVTAPAVSDDLTIVDIEFSKEFTNNPALPGGTVDLEFTLTNPSSEPATFLSFDNDFDATLTGLTLASFPAAPCAGSSISASAGDSSMHFTGELAAGATCTFSVTLSVPTGVSGDYTNEILGLYAIFAGVSMGFPGATDVLTVERVDLEFSKEFLDDQIIVGETTTLVFTITNPSSFAVDDIAFSDDLDTNSFPSGATWDLNAIDQTCTGAVSGTSTDRLFDYSGASLPAGESCYIQVDLNTDSLDTPGTYSNETGDLTATVSGVAVNGGTATDVLEIISPDAPAFTKEFLTPSVAGGTVDLKFTIDNTVSGASNIAGLSFTDDLDDVITGLAATGLPAYDICGAGSEISGTLSLSFTGGNLLADETCTFTVELAIPDGVDPDDYFNTTDLLHNGVLLSTSTTATLQIEPPPAFSKSFTPDSIAVNETSVLAFTIDNSASTLAATALEFSDNMPAGLEVVSTQSDDCGGTLTAVPGTSDISYSGGTVNAASTCMIEVNVLAISDGVLDNTTGDLTSSSGNSGTANATITVAEQQSDVFIEITDDVDPIVAGGTLTYTVTVTNLGPQEAGDTEVTTTLPAGVTFVSTSGCSQAPGIPNCPLGNIAVGANKSFTITVEVDSSTSGVITAKVSVITDTTDPDLTNNSASQDTTITSPEGTITIVKNTAPALAGDGTFEFTSTDSDLDAISLTTSGNTATSAALTKTAGTYTISEDELSGWVLDTLECTGDTDGGSVIDLNAREVAIDLDAGEAITCTFTNMRDEDAIIEETLTEIMKFMEERGDQIVTNQPDLLDRLRNRGAIGNSMLAFNGSGNNDYSSSTFSTSLQQIKSWHSSQNGGSYAGGIPTYDIWMQGRFSHTNTTSGDSELALMFIGGDYLINPDLVVGGVIQLDWAERDSTTTASSAKGFGWMAGPYFVTRPWQNVFVDGRVMWGQSYNEFNTLGLFTDDFDTERWLATFKVSGDFHHGRLTVRPAAELVYFHEHQKPFVNSLMIAIPGQTLELGRLIFGPEIRYQLELGNGATLSPSLKFEGIWDFHRAITTTATGIASGIDGLRARFDLALSYTVAGGIMIHGGGFYDGIGRPGYETYGGRIQVVVPISLH